MNRSPHLCVVLKTTRAPIRFSLHPRIYLYRRDIGIMLAAVATKVVEKKKKSSSSKEKKKKKDREKTSSSSQKNQMTRRKSRLRW